MKKLKIIITMIVSILSVFGLYAQKKEIDPFKLKYYYNIFRKDDNINSRAVITTNPDPASPYYFASQTEVRQGSEYHALMSSLGTTVAYVRKEGKKYYMLYDEELCNTFKINPEDKIYQTYKNPPKLGEEIVLFDFESPINSTYNTLCTTYSFEVDVISFAITEATVDISDYIVVNNMMLRRYDVKYKGLTLMCAGGYNMVVEGIGPVRGHFFAPLCMYEVDQESVFYAELDYVEDENGNVIFTSNDFGAPTYDPNGIGQLTDTSEQSRMYDLMGREIRNPEKGTVYIQNGRKFIAR